MAKRVKVKAGTHERMREYLLKDPSRTYTNWVEDTGVELPNKGASFSSLKCSMRARGEIPVVTAKTAEPDNGEPVAARAGAPVRQQKSKYLTSQKLSNEILKLVEAAGSFRRVMQAMEKLDDMLQLDAQHLGELVDSE